MLVLSLLGSTDCNEPVSGTFYSGHFLTKSVGISLRFWPRKRHFGDVVGVPVLVIFCRDAGIVTTKLGRMQWTSFRNLLFRTVFGRNPWVISVRFWPRKRLFGPVFGVPLLVIFRRGSGIVTTRLGRVQLTNFRKFLLWTGFGRNSWVLAFGFSRGNGF